MNGERGNTFYLNNPVDDPYRSYTLFQIIHQEIHEDPLIFSKPFRH
jgi:hypothetical protein